MALPIQNFIKTDARELRESKRAFERTMDRYETSLIKYSSLNRTKEPSALREVGVLCWC